MIEKNPGFVTMRKILGLSWPQNPGNFAKSRQNFLDFLMKFCKNLFFLFKFVVFRTDFHENSQDFTKISRDLCKFIEIANFE